MKTFFIMSDDSSEDFVITLSTEESAALPEDLEEFSESELEESTVEEYQFFTKYETVPAESETLFLIFLAIVFGFLFNLLHKSFSRMGGNFGNFS